MLKHMRVWFKILISFLIVFVLFVFSTIYNISNSNTISSTLNNFNEHPFTVSNKVKDVIIKLDDVHEYINDIFTETDRNKIIENHIIINGLEKEIIDDIKIIDDRFLGENMKVTALREAIFKTVNINDDMVNYILDGKYDEAMELKNTIGKEYEIEIEQYTSDMLLVSDYYASAFIEEANELHTKQQRNMIYIGIVSFIMILLIAYLLSNNISRPLRKLVGVIDSSDRLGDSIDLDIKRKDEIGQVNKSYKEMIENIRKRELQLRRSNRELEAFSYSVSHDLRAPLRHMTGYINLMKQKHGEELTEEAKRYLGIVQGASEKMDVLINSLLQYSRIGRKQLERTNVNIDEIAKKIVEEYKTENDDRIVDWRVNKLGNAFADETLITTVWQNLIGNAYKYTSKEDKAIIEIGKKIEGEFVVFYIKDNGIGFDMEYYDKIFSVFQRLHGEEEFKGVGIGLANVQRIITMHEGEVWAEAAPGKGATFYFKLGR